MTNENGVVLGIINPELGSGYKALREAVNSLGTEDKGRLEIVIRAYKDHFNGATKAYRSHCAYIITGIIQDHERGDLGDRVEVKCFGANLPDVFPRRTAHETYAREGSSNTREHQD